MPGLLGGLSAAVASYWAYQPNKLLIEHAHHQWAYQLLASLVTLGATAVSSLASCTAASLESSGCGMVC